MIASCSLLCPGGFSRGLHLVGASGAGHLSASRLSLLRAKQLRFCSASIARSQVFSAFLRPICSEQMLMCKRRGLGSNSCSSVLMHGCDSREIGSTIINYQPVLLTRKQVEAASRPPRFYIPMPLPAAAGEAIELDAEESRHAAKALRLGEGDAVELCDGGGGLLLGRIASLGKKAVTIEAAELPRQVQA